MEKLRLKAITVFIFFNLDFKEKLDIFTAKQKVEKTGKSWVRAVENMFFV